MLATFQFWLYTWAIVSTLVALSLCARWLYGKYLLWQHRRSMAILRLNPHQLKAIIKKKQALIGEQEDTIMKLQNERDEYKRLYDDMNSEVRLLNKRNMFMANELTCDQDKDTRVLQPVRPGRWYHGS